MDRTLIGRVMMGLGALLVVVGLLVSLTGDDDPEESASASTTTTVTTVAPTTAPATTAAPTTAPVASTSAPPTTQTTSTTTSTTAVPVPVQTVDEFLVELNDAFSGSDAGFLLGRLNEATLERYGVEQCSTYLIGILPQPQGLSMRRTVGVGSWNYATDDVTTSLAGVTAVEVDRVVNGETRINELHWQLVGDVFTWFTDCGEPVIID